MLWANEYWICLGKCFQLNFLHLPNRCGGLTSPELHLFWFCTAGGLPTLFYHDKSCLQSLLIYTTVLEIFFKVWGCFGFSFNEEKKNTKQNPEIWIKEAKFKTLPQIGCTQHLTRGTEKAWHILYCCRYEWGIKTKPLITLYIYFWNIVRTWSFVAFWKDYNSFIFVCLFAGERVLWDRDCCEPIIMWPKTTLTSGSLCLYFPDIQIAGMHPALCQFFLKLVDELVSHSATTLFRCLLSTTMYQEGS